MQATTVGKPFQKIGGGGRPPVKFHAEVITEARRQLEEMEREIGLLPLKIENLRRFIKVREARRKDRNLIGPQDRSQARGPVAVGNRAGGEDPQRDQHGNDVARNRR